VNAESDPEAAAWERARRLRVEREEADRTRRAERETAAAATVEEARQRERSNDRRAVVLWIAGLAAVGALVAVVIFVVASRASNGDDNDSGSVEAAEATEANENRLAPAGPLAGSTGQTGRRASPSLDAETPPVIDLTGDNFDRVWRQAQVLEGWLLRHPRPELVEQIYTPGTETYDEVHSYIQDLLANGRVLVVEKYRIVDIDVVARPAPDEVELRYTDTYEYRDLVDGSTDEVLEHEVSDGQARAWRLVLQRSPQGPWRVTSITPAPEVGA
jgi:hypothetical protein